MKKATLSILFLLLGCENKLAIRAKWGTPMNILVMGQSHGREIVDDNQRTAGIMSNVLHRVVHFIPCAAGGTAIEEWHNGGPLFDACIQRARDYHIDAVMFLQGEQNAIVGGATWAEQFSQIARDLRGDLHCPVYFSRLSNTYTPPPWYLAHWQEVRSQQEMIDPNLATMVSLDGIDPGTCNPHYCIAGYMLISNRFALEMAQQGA